MARTILSNEHVSDSDSSDEEFQAPKGSKHTPLKGIRSIDTKKKQVWIVKLPPNFNTQNFKEFPIEFDGTHPTFAYNKGSFTAIEDNEIEDVDSLQSQFPLIGDSPSIEPNLSRFYNVVKREQIPDIQESLIQPKPKVRKIDDLRMRYQPTGYSADDFEEARAPKRARKVRTENNNDMDIDTPLKEKKVKSHKKDKKDKKDKKVKKDKKEKKHKKHHEI